MRLMMIFRIPTAAGNEAGAHGDIGAAIRKLIEDTDAEAAYFTMMNGMRAGIVIFEEADQARLTTYNEPLMESLGAEIEIFPALNLDDLKRGLEGR